MISADVVAQSVSVKISKCLLSLHSHPAHFEEDEKTSEVRNKMVGCTAFVEKDGNLHAVYQDAHYLTKLQDEGYSIRFIDKNKVNSVNFQNNQHTFFPEANKDLIAFLEQRHTTASPNCPTPLDCIVSHNEIWRIAKAVHEHPDHPQKYLNKHFHHIEVLDQTEWEQLSWRMILCRNTKTDKLIVGFQGTNKSNPIHWVTDVACHLVDENGDHNSALVDTVMAAIEHRIARWEKNYGKIDVLTGFSQGGYHANHAMANRDDIWRITFGGHLCESGPRKINLALKSDPVSKSLSNNSEYIFLGKGKHDLGDYRSFIENAANWIELIPDFSELLELSADQIIHPK